MRKQKGITLIALVITIIVLLILAAVSITALTDEDKGVVTKAKEAARKTEESAEQEDEDIKEIIDYMEGEESEEELEVPNNPADTTAPTITTLNVGESWSGSQFNLEANVSLSNVLQTDYPISIKYYLDGALKTTKTLSSGTTSSYTFSNVTAEDHIIKTVVSDTSGNSVTKQYNYTYTSCFVAGTKVLTENGYKNIEEIIIGEKVYSINVDTNQRELKTVIALYSGTTEELYEITVNGEIIKATPKHEFYIIDKGWIRAYNLVEGDMLSGENGNCVITNIEYKEYEEEIPVYNLTIDDNHNYLITENDYLVHNASIQEEVIPEI